MSTSNELRVFISSTFRDLQEEREHLVRKIFPEIRARCRERGVTFTEVDLRWGLTEEHQMLGQVVRTCLEEIDRCRPYFIGLLGGRYGWVPGYHEIAMDPELLTRYPWIEQLAIEGASVTEMEFVHGVFNAPGIDGTCVFFYHRQQHSTEPDDAGRLAAMIERARQTGQPFRDFQSVEELGRLVHDDLLEMIDRYWPQQQIPTQLERTCRAHAAFASSRRRAYIPNPEHLQHFERWMQSPAVPLVVVGGSGLGKSSLMAHLAEVHRRTYPDGLVIEHYVGAAESSGSAMGLILQVIGQICQQFGIEEELPSESIALERSFPNWLYRLEHLAAQHSRPVLLLIDAVNQLDEAARLLAWLPATFPQGVRLVISTTPGPAEDELLGRGWPTLRLHPLEDERLRQSLVVRYLAEFRKSIAPDGLRRVAAPDIAASPLYLRVVAEELRLHGDHQTLDEAIGRYAGCTTLAEVFERVLERIEHDHGVSAVAQTLALIAASRSGLSETDLLGLTGIIRLELSRLLFSLDYHLLRRDGLLGFFHDYLRQAVERRYLATNDARDRQHRLLARYFEQAGESVPSTLELLHALEQLGDRSRLESALCSIPRLLALWPSPARQELLRLWSERQAADIANAYAGRLRQWELETSPDAVQRSEAVEYVAELLCLVGGWEQAGEHYMQLLVMLTLPGQRRRRAIALSSLAHVLIKLGRMQQAGSRANEAESLARTIGANDALEHVLGTRGLIHRNAGRYDQALECFAEQERLARERDNPRGQAKAVGDRGFIYWTRGLFDQALECFAEQERLAREIGDQQMIGTSLGNRGRVHAERGEYEQARRCFTAWHQIARNLGNRSALGAAVADLGIIHLDLGQYDQAVDCFVEQEQIARELGEKARLAEAVGHRGLVYALRGEYQPALECLSLREQLARELDDKCSLCLAVGHLGFLHLKFGEYDLALPRIAEQEQIARELEDRQSILRALGSRGGLHAELGEFDHALVCFRELQQLAHEMGDQRQIAAAMLDQASVLVQQKSFGSALDLLLEALEIGRHTGYRVVLDGCRQHLASLLLEVAAMPDAAGYLRQSMPQPPEGSPRESVLYAARAYAEELTHDIRQSATEAEQFAADVLLASIQAAEGDAAQALQQLETMLSHASDNEQLARLHYEIARAEVARAEGRGRREEGGCTHHAEALRLYRQLYAKIPKHEYRLRIDELSASIEPTTSEAADAAD